MTANKTCAYGALHAMAAVALGAFGAHGLEARLDENMLAVFDTGARYHMYHALGLVLIGLLAARSNGSRKLLWSGRLLHAGIFLFSGSLYALSLSGLSKLGILTPIGGLAFLAGWLLAAVSLWNGKKEKGAR